MRNKLLTNHRRDMKTKMKVVEHDRDGFIPCLMGEKTTVEASLEDRLLFFLQTWEVLANMNYTHCGPAGIAAVDWLHNRGRACWATDTTPPIGSLEPAYPWQPVYPEPRDQN